MEEGKKKYGNYEWVTKCLNWCWNYRYAVTGMVAAVVAMWFWRFWLHFNETDVLLPDNWYKEFVEDNVGINILIFVYTIFIAVLWTYYVCRFRKRWYHLFIYGIAISTLWLVPALEPVNTPVAFIPYHVWVTCILGIVTFIEIYVMIFTNRSDNQTHDTTGFLAHIEYERHQPTGWGIFVDTLLGMIGTAHLQQDSFTIGITGSWGSGKTTFYKILKRRIEQEGKFTVCEFKPWQVVNYTQLSAQFFSTFTNHLINIGVLPESDLISDIVRYSGFLESVPKISEYARPFIKVLQAQEETSLQALHDQIEKVLVDSDFQIAVMIDDLDRLNQNELMEVLRLIRISANFRNVLFIVTYDKGHIANLMGKDGKEYLKKIVNVEINLPPIENYKYTEILLDNIQRIVSDLSQTQINELKGALRAINKDTRNTLLNKYSHNFRDLLRFSNHLGLVLTHLKSLNLLNEYNLFDLFWLEMLRYFDEDTYFQLQEHPLSLLKMVDNAHTKQVYLTLNDKTQNDDTLKSKAILNVLFDVNRTNYGNTIIWTNNYNNYFAHRFLDNAVSMMEFSTLMEGCIQSAYLHKQVVKWQKGYQRLSLEQVVKNYPHNNVFPSELAVINYLRVLFELLELKAFNGEYLKALFRAKSRFDFFRGLQRERLKLLLRRTIAQHPNYDWNYLLTAMCVEWTQEMEEWEDYSRFENEFLLNHQELTELAELNYMAFFRGEKMSLSELFNPDSKHFQFVCSLAYVHRVSVDQHNNEIKQYRNLIGNFIVDQFDRYYTLKSGTKEFKYLYDNLLKFAGVQGMEDESMAIDLVQETIERTLGSLSNFEKIIHRHYKLNSIYTKRCKDLGIKVT